MGNYCENKEKYLYKVDTHRNELAINKLLYPKTGIQLILPEKILTQKYEYK